MGDDLPNDGAGRFSQSQRPWALATVVGVLVEVPVMLLLVAFANRTKYHFQ